MAEDRSPNLVGAMSLEVGCDEVRKAAGWMVAEWVLMNLEPNFGPFLLKIECVSLKTSFSGLALRG